MRSRTYAVLVTAALVLTLLSGCGSHDSTPAPVLPGVTHSSGGSDALDNAFWRRAGAGCGSLLRWFNQHPHGLSFFNPLIPTKPTLARFHAVAVHIPIYEPGAITHLLHRLGEPRTGVDQWDAIALDLKSFQITVAHLMTDAGHQDVAGWKRHHDELVDQDGTLGAAIDVLGLPRSNQCVGLFG